MSSSLHRFDILGQIDPKKEDVDPVKDLSEIVEETGSVGAEGKYTDLVEKGELYVEVRGEYGPDDLEGSESVRFRSTNSPDLPNSNKVRQSIAKICEAVSEVLATKGLRINEVDYSAGRMQDHNLCWNDWYESSERAIVSFSRQIDLEFVLGLVPNTHDHSRVENAVDAGNAVLVPVPAGALIVGDAEYRVIATHENHIVHRFFFDVEEMEG